MYDYIAKATVLSGQIVIYAAVSTNTVEKVRTLHQMHPTPAVALGRVLTGVALMSQTLKEESQTITVQIRGNGPIGSIVAITDSKAGVRGYAHNPHFDVPLNAEGKFDIKTAVGEGQLNVIKDLGLKEPYIGHVELVSGEIAEDLTYYYAYSEQIPTVMNLGVLIGPEGNVLNAGGFFIQLLPGASEEAIDMVENGIKDLLPITTLIDHGNTPEDIIKLIFSEEHLVFNEPCQIDYKCNCNRERMERNLLSLGKKDLTEIAQDEDGAELVCHFCNDKYLFDKEELRILLDNSNAE